MTKRKTATKTPPKTPTTWREWRTLFLADTEKPFVGSCAWDRPEEAKSASGVPILVECRVVQPLARKRGGK